MATLARLRYSRQGLATAVEVGSTLARVRYSGRKAGLTRYQILGTVYKFGAPANSALILLIDRNSKSTIKMTRSEPDGSFVFTDVALKVAGYTVVIIDSDSAELIKTADFVTPELM